MGSSAPKLYTLEILAQQLPILVMILGPKMLLATILGQTKITYQYMYPFIKIPKISHLPSDVYDDARLRFQSVHFPSAEQKRALLVRIELQDNYSWGRVSSSNYFN